MTATLRVSIEGTLLRGALELDGQRIDFSAERPVLGRAEGCEIRLQRDFVCRRHVEFDQLDGVIRIRDLRSPQGIFVNGRHVQTLTHCPLRDGDVVRIGVRDFLFRIG